MTESFEYVVITAPFNALESVSERLTEEINRVAQFGWRCTYGPALQNGPMNWTIWTATMERPKEWQAP